MEKSLHEQEQARGVLQARLAETLEQLGVRPFSKTDPCIAAHTKPCRLVNSGAACTSFAWKTLRLWLQVQLQRTRPPTDLCCLAKASMTVVKLCLSALSHKRASLMICYCVLLQEANEETVQQASTAAQLASQIDELHSHRVSRLCAVPCVHRCHAPA